MPFKVTKHSPISERKPYKINNWHSQRNNNNRFSSTPKRARYSNNNSNNSHRNRSSNNESLNTSSDSFKSNRSKSNGRHSNNPKYNNHKHNSNHRNKYNKSKNNSHFKRHWLDLESDFEISQIHDRIFQIGNDANNSVNKKDFDILINIFNRGKKFIPCFYLNNFHFFKNLLYNFEINTPALNNSFLCSKIYKKWQGKVNIKISNYADIKLC